MDEKTLAALNGSIAKWEAIVAGDEIDDGVRNCPLCVMFFYDDCAGCPVAEKTGNWSCIKSPYDSWSKYNNSNSRMRPISEQPQKRRAKLTRLAQAELDFLRSLLPAEAQS